MAAKKDASEGLVALSLYVPPGVKSRITELAKKERRSVSNQAVLLLESALAALK